MMDRFVIRKRKSADGDGDTDTTAVGNSNSNDAIPSTSNSNIDDEISKDLISSANVTKTTISKSSNSTTSTSTSKKNKTVKKSKKVTFCSKWLDNNRYKGWLVERDGKAFCLICSCPVTSHKSALDKHINTAKHINKSKAVANTKDVEELIVTPEQQKIAIAELKLSAFIAANNCPFLLMDSLVPLCKDIFRDSKTARALTCRRTKTTSIVANVLGPVFDEELYSILQDKPFSLIFDETTDCSTLKQCASTVIYFDDRTNDIQRAFFDLYEGDLSGDCITLCNGIKHSFELKGIPLQNMVGFSSDTTNVMAGEIHSLFVLLKKEIPHLLTVKCTCHMIHLCASYACKKLPRSTEDLLRDVASHFSRSPKRQMEFAEIQRFFEDEITSHKILKRAETRWLSRKQCVDRIIEQYGPLKTYFSNLAKDDRSRTTENIQTAFENPFTIIYLEFMSYALSLLDDINLMYQSRRPMLFMLKTTIQKLLRNIYANIMPLTTVKEIKDVFQFNHFDKTVRCPIDKIYLGIRAHESMKVLKTEKTLWKPEDLSMFYTSCLDFYIEVIQQVKTRFDFSDNVYDFLKIVDPETVSKNEDFSFTPILKRFPNLKVDPEKLNTEYRDLCLSDLSVNTNDPDPMKFWSVIFGLKNSAGEVLYPNVSTVIKFLLILPYSNADVERVFSDLHNIKTDKRNKLKTRSVKALLRTKDSISDAVNFQPSKKHINRYYQHKEELARKQKLRLERKAKDEK